MQVDFDEYFDKDITTNCIASNFQGVNFADSTVDLKKKKINDSPKLDFVRSCRLGMYQEKNK